MKTKKIMAAFLAALLTLSLAACGKQAGDSQQGEARVWYLGGNNAFAGDVDVEALFENAEDTANVEQIYNSLAYTAEMFYGAYTLNQPERDVKTVREEMPFEEVEGESFKGKISALPIAVYCGADYVSSQATSYRYGEFAELSDAEVAVLQFATEDKTASLPCVYTIAGHTIAFEGIEQTNDDGKPFAYQKSGLSFAYEFDLRGPYLTLTKGEHSLRLMAYCLTDAADSDLSLSGYSLPDSPLIDELDYFASAKAWNYAVRRDGSYYDLTAYKMSDDGRFTVYLSDQNPGEEEEVFIDQYAYLINSDANSFLTDFSIILLDGEKQYYYTDDITKREARILKEEGVDASGLTDDEVKAIAEKKSDLFDDLYAEFEKQGIKVTINRSTGEIAMDSSVLFGGDSAAITEDGKTLLNKFLEVYASIIYNEKYDGFIQKTLIEGHTAPLDGSTYESGLPLSQERADNVKAYCLSAKTGADTTKLTATLEAVGCSNSRPVYDSNGNVDMAASRRVSFRFVVNTAK